MRLLIDADYYLFRSATGNEYEFELQPDCWTYLCRIDQAKADFTEAMDYLQSIVPEASLILCLGDTSNFRYALYPQYKASRRKYRRPAGLNALRTWATQCYPSLTLANVEGDDVLGVMAEPGDVIASVDKDLRTIPGCHLEGDSIIDVNESEADFKFYMQALTGDATDGYPGCKGMGPKRAGELLATCTNNEERWAAVLQTYIKSGQTYDFALRMARCARILRPGEYDHEKNQPILWNPPTQ